MDFLESLKATYESQAGVPLNYRRYPVTNTDPQTNRTGKDTLWRQSAKRQIFSPLEAGGSLCLGSARGMAFRSAFGLHKPSNRQVLTKLKVENEDLETSYGIKNVKVVSASRKDAFDALKNGAPIIADLEGGWHWVLLQRSPRGQLWANDPLGGSGIRRTTAGDLGTRFELIVDAQSNQGITVGTVSKYQK